MKQFWLVLSIIFIWTCDSGDNPLDIKGLYDNDDYTTHTLQNYTFSGLNVQSTHPDGFVTLLNELGGSSTNLDPTNFLGLGIALRVRHNTEWTLSSLSNSCSPRYKRESKSASGRLYPVYYFWCEEQFGEEGPNTNRNVVDENYFLVTLHNRSDCSLVASNSSQNINAFYDMWTLKESTNSFDIRSKPYNILEDSFEISYNEFKWFHNNSQLVANISDNDCANCTLRYELRTTTEEGSTEQNYDYFFWCLEEFGESGPTE